MLKLNLTLLLAALFSCPLFGQIERPEFESKKTWQPVSQSRFSEEVKNWAETANFSAAEVERIQRDAGSQFSAYSGRRVDLIVQLLALYRPDIRKMVEGLSSQKTSTTPPEFSSLLENESESRFVRDHLRLYFARWLVQNQFLDESLIEFSKLELSRTLDPPSFLFYKGLAEHQLLKKEDCVKTCNALLEHPEVVPKRYEVLAKLVVADMGPLKEDSLDEISRMMADIGRRTGLHRSGKRVLGQEEVVIKKLDKLIEQLEAAQQKQQQAGSVQPSSPMETAQNAGGQGSGEVVGKRLKDGGDWGNLPPAERAAALAEMAKSMPPHYRPVIEEYFRQLAKEEDK